MCGRKLPTGMVLDDAEADEMFDQAHDEHDVQLNAVLNKIGSINGARS